MNDKKPRLCEILGVEVGEEFKIKGWEDTRFCVDRDVLFLRQLTKEEITGRPDYYKTFAALCEMIEHPERIIRQTKSLTYTEQEIAIMRGRVAEGYKWLVRDEDGVLYFYEQQPFVTSRRFGTLLYERNTPYFPQITIENSPVNMEEELNRMGRRKNKV